MTYDDAVAATVTAEEARREIEKHNLDWHDFTADHGNHPTYKGATVLAWLGY